MQVNTYCTSSVLLVSIASYRSLMNSKHTIALPIIIWRGQDVLGVLLLQGLSAVVANPGRKSVIAPILWNLAVEESLDSGGDFADPFLVLGAPYTDFRAAIIMS